MVKMGARVGGAAMRSRRRRRAGAAIEESIVKVGWDSFLPYVLVS